MKKRRLLLWLPLLCFTCCGIYSCAPKLQDVEAPIDEPQEFTYSGDDLVPDKWWTAFDDPALNLLVETGLEENLALAGNWEQFRAALAVVRRESSYLWPAIGASAQTARSRPQPDFAGGENFQLGLSASYEVDLWGRIQSGIEAEEFRAQATYYDYQSAAMTLSAEISNAWYRLLTARKQLELANKQIETNENIMRLIRARFVGGQIRAVDILRQEQLLESTRNQKIAYETQVELFENELAVLLGSPPQNLMELPKDSLPGLPPLPATGLPLELIRRRPDVLQAYNLVLATDRDMAQAIRSKFPQLSLNVQGQNRSNDYNSLFQNWAYTLAGNIAAPIFYAGRIRAEVDRTEALKNRQLYLYGQTVLTAFREVEDAMVREIKQKEQLEVLQRRTELAEKTSRQLRLEFLNGISEYLDVLLTLDQEQQLERDILEARQSLLEIRVALYRALAGGFEPERPAEP
ncbi:efflux transporter outer membrane subunit [Autumnicola musiva]|uniref:Efflux transporter outer membrane subunit n=1 Tax=Autumnicola musiva TaxID=3075589 RepID=A0ABU3D3B7_9FLAO|nr:efflux transporter outer membrane subunit [Zunongwangia sp. F117]MDT0675860.1 efflux transporter outer membrane subunit [Zunongwangia sp. F117]